MQPKPICRAFNVAVNHIAARLFPNGYDVSERAPESLPALNQHIAATGRMLVWSGASNDTIFADPETNWAFRAWHDWHHWKLQAKFTPEGERAVYEAQCALLSSLYPGHHLLSKWRALLDIEVNGQLAHEATYGSFPANQRAFAEYHLPRHPFLAAN